MNSKLNYTLVPTEEFLVGDLLDRVELYRDLPGFETEFHALQQALPQPVPIAKIEIPLGAQWVPEYYHEQWCWEQFRVRTKWFYSAMTANWDVQVINKGELKSTQNTDIEGFTWLKDAEKEITDCIKAIDEGGERTQGLVQMALNFKTPLIQVVVRQGDQVSTMKHPGLTADAIAKQRRLADQWQTWCRQGERGEVLADIYNRQFNRDVLPDWTGAGENLEIFGISDEWRDRVRLYQKDEVVASMRGNHLIGAEVGLGKTLIAACAIAQRLYCKMARKVMVVVQKSTLHGFANEFKEAFPDIPVLVASTDSCSKPKRLEFLAKIAFHMTYGVVILTHDSFDAIGMRGETEKRFIEERLKALEQELNNFYDRGESGSKQKGKRANRVVKKLEETRNDLKARLGELSRSYDCGFYFKDLGIDYLVVDECDRYKNDLVSTQLAGIVGINTSDSDRAQGFALKCQWMNDQYNESALLFMTGTPEPDNWLGGVYVFQRFLQPSLLKKRGVLHFDAWARTFGRVEAELEVKVGGTLAVTPRFGEFVNVQELKKMWLQVCHVTRYAQVEEQIKEKRPIAKVVEVSCEPTHTQLTYMEWVGNRYHLIRKQSPLKFPKFSREGYLLAEDKTKTKKGKERILYNPDTKQPIASLQEFLEVKKTHKDLEYKVTVDNFYSVAGDGKKCMLAEQLLDPKMLEWAGCDPNPPLSPDGKLAKCVELLVENHSLSHSQLVFCDMGTPGGSARFPIYEFLRNECVKRGIPKERIAFIHDYPGAEEREELFRRVNEAEVNILVMSTQMGGIGVNVKKKAKYMYLLDIPAKPSWWEQRLGRIVRSGNEHKEVTVYQFLTQGGGKGNYGADAFYFQLNQKKIKLREQLWDAKVEVRTVKQDANTELFLALMAQSSGDGRLQEYCDVRIEYQRVKSDRNNAESLVNHLTTNKDSGLPGLNKQLEQVKTKRHERKNDVLEARSADVFGDKFLIAVGNEVFESSEDIKPSKVRALADTALQQAVTNLVLEAQKAHVTRTVLHKIGEYGGFDIQIAVTLFKDRYEVDAHLQGDCSYWFKWVKSNKLVLTKLEQKLLDIARSDEMLEEQEDELIAAIVKAEQQVEIERDRYILLDARFVELGRVKARLEDELGIKAH